MITPKTNQLRHRLIAPSPSSGGIGFFDSLIKYPLYAASHGLPRAFHKQ
jgi:hypothetical protein